MKQFFKMMLASAVGVVIAGGILSFISFMMMIGVISSLSSSSDKLPKGDEKVLALALRGSLPEVSVDNPFGNLLNQNKSHSVKDIISAIENAKENKQIEGILLDVDYLLAGTATVDYLRRALIDFKQSGKFIVAYGDSYSQNGYYLSSVADKVFLNPLGMLSLTGFSRQSMFYKGILKKAGVEILVFKVGTFKGAVEPFMLDKLSDANREQITAYQQGLWKNIVVNIAADRNITDEMINGFADNGLMFSKAENAVEYGLVDELKYREDALKYVKELVGADLMKPLKTVDVAKMKNFSKKKPALKADRIAVVYAEGDITSSVFVSPYSNGNNITEKLVDELIKIKRDDKVKAVVLRVNSPGGSIFVSEQIWKQVNDLKNEKKIVVSMGDVAASGGYYIACAADKIIAEANTLTGSIGVFGTFPNMTGLFNMLDLTTDVVKTNKYSDMLDPSRPMREDEKAIIQTHVEQMYDLFLQRCADGRGMTKEEIDVIAQGRVWTGEKALEIGLVDELGDIDYAIKVAAELAGLTDYQVKTVTGSSDSLMDFLKKQMGESKSSVVKEALGDDYELMNKIRSIRQATGIQARLPFDMEVL